MGMKSMYDLRDMLCKELEENTRKGELGAGDLDIVHKLASTIKNIDKIEAMEDDGYSSRRDESDMRGSRRRGTRYRRHYVRGHYSRTDAAEHLRSQINDMMRETDDDRIKDALRRAMDMMED